ncbi:MAG: NAD(P)-binding protein [Syntrophales bacterium]|nr:NAD(P)-binding protein [Syntrophales bacterium]
MMREDATPGDILIIGSGIGGLTAGILLSKLGFPVTIVERATQPGGLMRSYRRCDIDCPTGVHYLGALDQGQPLRRLWDCLGVTPLIPLERMGADGIIDRYIFDDFVFDLPEGIDAFEDNLCRAFPEEYDQIAAITGDLREMSRVLSGLDMVLSPTIANVSPQSMDPMGRRLLKMGCSSRLIAVLSVPAVLIGVPLNDCPIFYYYMTLASYLMSSWRLAEGSNTMAEAFLSRFSSLGGTVIAGDGAKAIEIDAGRAKGVILQSGRILSATTVIAAIHPKTILALLPPEAVRSSYAERVTTLLDTEGLLGVNVAVDAEEHPALPYNIYRLHPEENGNLYRGIFNQIRRTGQTGTNLLSMITASGIEEWQPWEKTTSGRRGTDYESRKAEKAYQVMEAAARLFGPLGDAKVLDCYTPLTVRDWVHSPDGSPYGILRSASQLMRAVSLNRLPVKGLFLAGQNRLSPGIMGTVLGSFQAVRQVVGQERFTQDVAGGFQ